MKVERFMVERFTVHGPRFTEATITGKLDVDRLTPGLLFDWAVKRPSGAQPLAKAAVFRLLRYHSIPSFCGQWKKRQTCPLSLLVADNLAQLASNAVFTFQRS